MEIDKGQVTIDTAEGGFVVSVYPEEPDHQMQGRHVFTDAAGMHAFIAHLFGLEDVYPDGMCPDCKAVRQENLERDRQKGSDDQEPCCQR